MNKLVKVACACAFVLLVSGCGMLDGAPSITANSDSTTKPVTLEDKLAAAKDLEKNLLAQKQSDSQNLTLLRNVNQRFCSELADYRTRCVPQTRLIFDPAEKVMGCIGNSDQPKTDLFQISFTGGAGQFVLLANNELATDEFAEGTDTAVTWKRISSQDYLAPKISQVTGLRLKVSPGTTLPSKGSVKFTLKVNGTVLLDETDLLDASATNDYFEVSLRKIQALNVDSKCRISPEQLDKIADDIRSQTSLQLQPEDAQ